MSSDPLVPIARTRVKLAVSGALTIGAVTAGLPAWTVAALALTSIAIPVAVVLAGGGRLLRELLLPVPGDDSGSGLAHTPEESERLVT
ncbi:hypothetical protein [Micromonospora avicenniae]|uniref:Uncharacterized protein n=1 Tax=Micromonospora avicenniae TaxID=1198245 RepID=A0A1N7D5I8_9ACTN|nr:hypothetical protein [Micromonospora avicenniae]SIR71027.1 hypothetical protein SAMN05444858_11540 [Micromonospora avicenniae]